MKYNELIVAKQKSLKRVGRGIAAGQGKTAGRVRRVKTPVPVRRVSQVSKVVRTP